MIHKITHMKFKAGVLTGTSTEGMSLEELKAKASWTRECDRLCRKCRYQDRCPMYSWTWYKTHVFQGRSPEREDKDDSNNL
jgi:hypothetical protein